MRLGTHCYDFVADFDVALLVSGVFEDSLGSGQSDYDAGCLYADGMREARGRVKTRTNTEVIFT